MPLCLSLLSALALCQGAQAAPDLSPTEKVYGLSLFWKEAADHFAFFDKVPDLNWDRKYQEYIPKVLDTKSTGEYYGVLQEFARLLHDSHTDVNPPPNVRTRPPLAGPGVSVAWDEGVRRLWVFNVFKSLQDRIPVGSEVVKVEGQAVNDYVQSKWGHDLPSLSEERKWDSLYSMALAGPPETEAHFTIVTPDGQTREVSAPRKRLPGDTWAWNSRPQRDLVEYRDLGDGIAYVALNYFGETKAVQDFEKLIPTLQSAKGLILDLRNNPGGDDLVGMRICQHLTTGKFQGFRSKTRMVKSAYKAWGAFVDPSKSDLNGFERECLDNFRGTAWVEVPPDRFEGLKNAELLMPKIVLSGTSTASAAEDTLIYMLQIPNLTTMGQHTFGGTGQPLVFNLPGGGSARVCTQHCSLPDGREFMGIGIKPQVEVPAPTVKERIARKDTTLDRAIELMKTKIR